MVVLPILRNPYNTTILPFFSLFALKTSLIISTAYRLFLLDSFMVNVLLNHLFLSLGF